VRNSIKIKRNVVTSLETQASINKQHQCCSAALTVVGAAVVGAAVQGCAVVGAAVVGLAVVGAAVVGLACHVHA
jgi:hypothetical protein